MIPIDEFLNLRAPALDVKVLREWQHAADAGFVAYILQHHAELDYLHLRCALRILQNVDSAEVRDLFAHYAAHPEPGYKALAKGSLELQAQRGWSADAAVAK